MMKISSIVSKRCVAPTLSAVVGVGMLCMSFVGSDANANVDMLAAEMAPNFVASTFDVACPGVKRAKCNVNHHCPLKREGALKGDATKGWAVTNTSKKFCIADGGSTIGCNHVFTRIQTCATPQPVE